MWHPQRGEVYRVDFDPTRGSEQGGERPAVVISTDATNRHFPVVTVAACSSQVQKYRASKLALILPAGTPCPKETAVLPWQVLTVSNQRLIGNAYGVLTEDQLDELGDRLRLIWGLLEERDP